MRSLKIAAAVGAVSLSVLGARLMADEWPQWRGAKNDGIVREEKISETWPAEGPQKLWSHKVGTGFASPVAVNGRIYIFSLEGGIDTLRCYDDKGTEVYKTTNPRLYKGQMPRETNSPDWTGERSSPVIENDRIYTHGIAGDLVARKLESGDVIWHINVLNEIGGTPVTWGQSSNPTIDGDVMYVQGGKGGAVCVSIDKNTGKINWKSETGLGGYAKPVLVDVQGTRQLIVFGGNALWAFDPKTGSTIWSVPWVTEYDVNAATPTYHEGKLFVTSAYKQGRCTMFQLSPTGAKELWTSKNMTSKYQPPILDNGFIYGNSEGTVRCLRWEDGKVMWTAAADRINQGGSVLRIAPDKLLLLSERGKLILARATPEKFQKLAEAKDLVEGTNIWATPLLYKGKMYVKGREELICFDVSGK